MYSLLAGFVEVGENVEESVHREVYEEVGIHINNLRYFGSQPWPFPHSLMIGFFAEYESGELRLQPEEIEDAQWFTKETLPTLPNPTTISGMMIETWLKNH
jgi:NAD+ diphosphatase